MSNNGTDHGWAHRWWPISIATLEFKPDFGIAAWGWTHGYLDDQGLVDVAVGHLSEGADPSPIELEVALLSPHQYGRLAGILDASRPELAVQEHAASQFWKWALLASGWQFRSEVEDALEIPVVVWEEFSHDPEVSPLVRFLPAGPGVRVGLDAILDRWHDWVVSGPGPRE